MQNFATLAWHDDEIYQKQIFGLQPNLIQLGKNFTTLYNAASRQKSTPGDDDKDTWSGTSTKQVKVWCIATDKAMFVLTLCQESVDICTNIFKPQKEQEQQ